MKKYGLQLRGPPAKPLPPPKKPSIFNDDDDEDTVEQALARQSAKNRALKEVELQHKAALEQDSTVFAYDEIYDDLKAKSTPVIRINPDQNKPKYIAKLLDKAKVRQQEQEIIYERKLLKERQREDHLYSDKDKFVTTAYKQKLAEQAKWIEEEKLREMREQAEEVTNRRDLSDFYRNLLTKNVAFGGTKQKMVVQEEMQGEQEKVIEAVQSKDTDLGKSIGREMQHLERQSDPVQGLLGDNESDGGHMPYEPGKGSSDMVHPVQDGGKGSPQRDLSSERLQPPGKAERKPPSEDALSAAKERFLARKRMRTS